MDAPACLPHDLFADARGQRTERAAFERLWVCGSIAGLARTTVAIVGTRSATGYGKAVARAFASDLAAAGCCIISGLALGIDAAAHAGALESVGVTIGVLGGGHRHFFPKRNRALAQAMIAAGGAVLSPFAPDERAYPSNFLQRNGVVAALSDAVVVIEAPARSGALNTAGWAAGRVPVFAVPGDVDRAHVAGCHALIRDGATLARSAADVLEAFGLSSGAQQPPHREHGEPGDPLQQQILGALQAGECGLDELIAQCNESPPRMLGALSLLELQGLVEARPGQRYAMNRLSRAAGGARR